MEEFLRKSIAFFEEEIQRILGAIFGGVFERQVLGFA